jgi:hypothetical protein
MSDLVDLTLPEGEGFPDQEALLEEGQVITDEEVLRELATYLTEEIDSVIQNEEREAMVQKWQKWRRQSEARPEQERKKYPWEGASNVAVPLALTNANGIFSLLKETFSQRDPFWLMKDETQEDQSEAEAGSALLNALAESPNHVNLRAANNTILYDLTRLGTQFVKVPWEIDRWMFKARGDGANLRDVVKTRRDSPTLIPMRMEDFLCRPHLNDVQRMPWVGHGLWLFEHELKQREAQGIFQNVEEVLKRGENQIDESKARSLSQMGIEITRGSSLYFIAEVYVFFDADDDGIEEDLKVWIDPVSQTILRVEVNDLGIRPIVRIPYLERPYELYAIGTGWMTEHMQDEIDALHNMRVDGTHIGSLQMYVTKRGGGLAPKMKFRPLLNIQVDDPSKDFLPIKFPDLTMGSLRAEMLAKEYADRATGASDAMMGFENQTASSRTTASGTMFLAQQGSRVFQALSESVEQAYSEVGQIVWFQCVRNRERLIPQLEGLVRIEHVEILKNLLQMPIEDIPSKFRFSVSTTDVQQTEMAKRQGILTLIQLYTQYGQQVFQLLPLIYSPQNQVPQPIKEVAAKFFVGATKMMDQVMEYFGEFDSTKFLPFVKNIEMMLEALDSAKNQQLGGLNVPGSSRPVGTQPRGGEGVGGPPSQSGVGNSSQVPSPPEGTVGGGTVG